MDLGVAQRCGIKNIELQPAAAAGDKGADKRKECLDAVSAFDRARMLGCLGSLPVTAQQNPPDFGHPIRNMSKGLPESKKTSEFTLSTRVAVEYEYLGREASLKKSPIGKISFDKS